MLKKIYLNLSLLQLDSNEDFFFEWRALNSMKCFARTILLEALGAEENYKAEYHRLKQMKEMGLTPCTTTSPASEQTLQNRISRTRFTRSGRSL